MVGRATMWLKRVGRALSAIRVSADAMKQLNAPDADICLIVEGAYPYVVGGVSGWLQDLMISLPDIRFHIVAIKPTDAPMAWKIKPPANVMGVTEVALSTQRRVPRALPAVMVEQAMQAASDFLHQGGSDSLEALLEALRQIRPAPQVHDLLSHPAAFALLRREYDQDFDRSSFHHFFWASHVLLGGLLAMCLAPLPKARAYHSISTGFAGLLAARASVETGRPLCLTEHGIYQLERQIEVLMADWIGDQVDDGLVLERDGKDLRDLWRRAFGHYSAACYDRSDLIVALYSANSEVQQRLGAPVEKLRVIPNGIDLNRFDGVPDERQPGAPLVALIGRVVPIKDVKTFIRAAALVHETMPAVRFVLMGPTDEDADYAAECFAMVDELGLSECFEFAGRVRIEEWMPRIDLLVLTSLSEAQPLVILEGGACHIPVVAPDVGSCREMIEGSAPGDEHGGIVTPLVNPAATADAIRRILSSATLRDKMGLALRKRVERDYSHEKIIGTYRALYRDCAARETKPVQGDGSANRGGASA
ncbi:GT4 family glycosyltransferase PelF [Sphingobium sufflavum]|uniref:GT4 family glycosyltransferase PelF n=1 Tax=Sphingobium sufflavum TaxID=1129547 RepID=UPI001F33FCBA|nr:GT4 family glycosyltransferase PelF [Sphingobium sufflavum]MCE7796317.1 GT4 family glycosyltransferase PelF [Sphingobium sufflavum]